ncbi:MAG: GatB/YqeY domain-containing protein [Alphaproteobacteria bacterium]|nr:GatB/YqeY domain-containing protein [Alphaproteobacteria bacterium]
MLREELTEAMKTAMRAKDEKALGTIRMVLAKLKDLDIAARPSGNTDGINDDQIKAMMQGMIKQRRESIALYKQGNRPDLVDLESAEIAVIERFLPKQLDEAATKDAVTKAIAAVGATSIKDMGKVMGELKKAYTGQMDFAIAGPMIKGLLGG